MNALMAHEPQQLTMSSRDIAVLTNKTHANVCRDIRNMLETLKIGAINFESSYLSEQNKSVIEYLLPRRECEILVTGYDVKRRAAVIDRWFQLENAKRNNIPTWIIELSPQAQICLNDLSNQLIQQKQITAHVSAANELLTEQVGSMQSKIESLSQCFIEGCTIPEFCRSLNGVNIQKVNAALEKQGVLYRGKNGYKVAGYYRNRYFREVKQEFGHEGKFSIRIEILRNGAKWLYARYADGYLPMNKAWNGHYFHSLA